MTAARSALFFLLAGSCAVVYPAALPDGVTRQLPAGYEVLASKAADLNNDKLTDYVVVLHKPDEKKIAERSGHAPRRPLLVFAQRPDRSFAIAARNDRVVYAIDQGGQCDPFLDDGEGIASKGSFFTVENGVACGNHWTDYITFKYSPDVHSWIFHKRIFESWVMNNDPDPDADALKPGGKKVWTGNLSHPVLLQDYIPE